MIRLIYILIIITSYGCNLIHISKSSQLCNSDFLCTPDTFSTYINSVFINEINNDVQQISDFIKYSSTSPWIVYSDRDDNKLKHDVDGINNDGMLDFMQACLVKEISGNWLNLYDYKDVNKELGWIHAKYLLLSRFSYIDDSTIFPKRCVAAGAITIDEDEIKDSLYNMISFNGLNTYEPNYLNKLSKNRLDSLYDAKYFVFQSNVPVGPFLGEVSKGDLFTVFKEDKNLVLLGVNDALTGNYITSKILIKGWIPKNLLVRYTSRVQLADIFCEMQKEGDHLCDIPSVFLTENEYRRLQDSFNKLLYSISNDGPTSLRLELKDAMIQLSKTFIDPNISTTLILDKTFGQVWEELTGISLKSDVYEIISNCKLSDLTVRQSLSDKAFYSFIEEIYPSLETFSYGRGHSKYRWYKNGTSYYFLPIDKIPGW